MHDIPVDTGHGLEVVTEAERYQPDCNRNESNTPTNLGFQSESIKHSREAPMRLRPTPPAFELSRNTTDVFA